MSGIQFARIRGVPMTLHPTAIILALLAASWAFPVQSFNAVEKFVAASAAIIGVFLSILLHELGHVFAARLWNVGTTEVTLWGLGGMARLERPAPTPTAEAVISAAGPVVSITLGAIATIALNTTIGLTAPGRSLATFIFFMLAYWNVLIGVFNLLPGPPLDGGGIVRGIAWGLTGSRQKASKVAAVLGLVAAGIAIIIAISDTTVTLSFLPFEFDTAFMAVFAAFLLVFGSSAVLRSNKPGSRQATEQTQSEATATVRRSAEIAAEVGADAIGTEHLLVALAEDAQPPLSILCARYRLSADSLRTHLTVQSQTATGQMSQPPPFSVGVRQVLGEARTRGVPGNVGLFLAIPAHSAAGRLATRTGADLAAMQAEVTPTQSG